MLSLSKDSPVTCMSITKKTQTGKKNCSWGESNVGRRMSSGGDASWYSGDKSCGCLYQHGGL